MSTLSWRHFVAFAGIEGRQTYNPGRPRQKAGSRPSTGHSCSLSLIGRISCHITSGRRSPVGQAVTLGRGQDPGGPLPVDDTLRQLPLSRGQPRPHHLLLLRQAYSWQTSRLAFSVPSGYAFGTSGASRVSLDGCSGCWGTDGRDLQKGHDPIFDGDGTPGGTQRISPGNGPAINGEWARPGHTREPILVTA